MSVWVDVPNQALVFFIQETHSSMWHLFSESVPSANRECSVIQIGAPRRSTGFCVGDGPIALSGTPAGDVWSGTGVSGTSGCVVRCVIV
jgi:hypothetical protein